jgi:hypothetical protein
MRFSRFVAVIPTLAFLAVAACQQDQGGRTDEAAAEPATESAADAQSASKTSHVVEVIARDFSFEAPAEIPSGWTTFRLRNEGAQEHFMILWRLPEGKTVEDYENEIAPAFDIEAYAAGTIDRETAIQTIGGLLPEWYGGVSGAGGPGIVSRGGVAQTTIELEPGYYVIECYVKAPDGKYHSMLGMLEGLTVTAEQSGASPPKADIEMALTNYEITTEGEFTPGMLTVRVRFMDTGEGILGHDVHLVRLTDGVSVDDVIPWMDWMDAFMAPAPAEFLGGAEQMLAGSTAYITVNLESGSYAWISEEFAARGMVKEFVVE